MHVFVRHCFQSSASANKGRPNDFNRETFFNTLQQSLQGTDADLTVLLDESKRQGQHFTERSNATVVCVNCSTESSSFATLLQHLQQTAEKHKWNDTDIVVSIEDDYNVSADWPALVREGLHFGSYVTLYDHPDKYSPMYAGVPSQVFCGRLSHWRTTPSTTNTFATRWGTLKADMQEHFESCEPSHPVTRDHARFLALWTKGKSLVSCLPGRWSHEEEGMQSPFWAHSNA